MQLLEKNTTKIRSFQAKMNQRRKNNEENAELEETENPVESTNNMEIDKLMMVRPIGATGVKSIETLLINESQELVRDTPLEKDG